MNQLPVIDLGLHAAAVASSAEQAVRLSAPNRPEPYDKGL